MVNNNNYEETARRWEQLRRKNVSWEKGDG
jgi:hypothetical protein